MIQAESVELSRELTSYLQNIEIDDSLQQGIEDKIQSIFNFCRKYNIKPENLESESEIWLQGVDELKTMLGEKDISFLVDEAKTLYDELAFKVSKKRKITAGSLSNVVTEKLNQLSSMTQLLN